MKINPMLIAAVGGAAKPVGKHDGPDRRGPVMALGQRDAIGPAADHAIGIAAAGFGRGRGDGGEDNR